MPEFTNEGEEEVKQAPSAPETETPTELPAEEQPAEAAPEKSEEESAAAPVEQSAVKQVQGLQEERAKLLAEIQQLRGQRRELKKEELLVVNKQIEELTDVNPDDVKLIDKVLRAKGYLTKEESNKMHYDAVKQEQVDAFLEKYPEYKPENDPHDLNWSALQRELGFYRMPDDARKVGDVLLRAHRAIAKPAPPTSVPAKQHQARVASVGSGGTQRQQSSTVRMDEQKRAMLLNGGWTEEEIQKIESNL